jgi:RloB-like protein
MQSAANDARLAGDPGLAFDEIWCVVDVDEHKRLPEARNLAEKHGVRLAVSNPRFELWALLHFREQHAHIAGDEVVRLLRGFIPKYDKRIPCHSLLNGYEKAVQRAKLLERLRIESDDPHGNPSTGVWRLVERMRADAASSSR